MSDAMVTVRMAKEKKEAGNRVLEQLGTNALQAVNRLFDYVIEKRELPFPEEGNRHCFTPEEVAEAIAWTEGVRSKHAGRFDRMTLKDAKRERLADRGLYDGWEE